jgi:hypothetical protein
VGTQKPVTGFFLLFMKNAVNKNKSCIFVLYGLEKRRAFGCVFTGWPFVFLCFAGLPALFEKIPFFVF